MSEGFAFLYCFAAFCLQPVIETFTTIALSVDFNVNLQKTL